MTGAETIFSGDSLAKVSNGHANVLLNLSVWPFPLGLYGVFFLSKYLIFTTSVSILYHPDPTFMSSRSYSISSVSSVTGGLAKYNSVSNIPSVAPSSHFFISWSLTLNTASIAFGLLLSYGPPLIVSSTLRLKIGGN